VAAQESLAAAVTQLEVTSAADVAGTAGLQEAIARVGALSARFCVAQTALEREARARGPGGTRDHSSIVMRQLLEPR
jgi:hypothetical protein